MLVNGAPASETDGRIKQVERRHPRFFQRLGAKAEPGGRLWPICVEPDHFVSLQQNRALARDLDQEKRRFFTGKALFFRFKGAHVAQTAFRLA